MSICECIGYRLSHLKLSLAGLSANDYITKPFDVEELFARIRAVSRRREEKIELRTISMGEVRIDFTRRSVSNETGKTAIPHLTQRVRSTLLRDLAWVTDSRRIKNPCRGQRSTTPLGFSNANIDSRWNFICWSCDIGRGHGARPSNHDFHAIDSPTRSQRRNRRNSIR